jgi:hypothetical protein
MSVNRHQGRRRPDRTGRQRCEIAHPQQEPVTAQSSAGSAVVTVRTVDGIGDLDASGRAQTRSFLLLKWVQAPHCAARAKRNGQLFSEGRGKPCVAVGPELTKRPPDTHKGTDRERREV